MSKDRKKVRRRIVAKNILFSFSYKNEMYFVMKTDDGNAFECFRGCWHAVFGWSRIREDVGEEVIGIAKYICQNNVKAPRDYPLVGEYYVVDPMVDGRPIKVKLKSLSRTALFDNEDVHGLIIQVLIAIICSVTVYCLFVRTCIEWLSFLIPLLNKKLLMFIVGVFEAGGAFILFYVFTKKREFVNLLFNAIFPMGMIVLSGMIKLCPWIALLLPLAIAVTYFIVVSCNGILGEKLQYKSKAHGIVLNLRSSLIVIVSVCMLTTAILGTSPHSIKSARTVSSDVSVEELRQQVIDSCWKIEYENFEKLDAKERLKLLQLFCDYECIVTLGCAPANVRALDIEDESVLGCYAERTQTITIDIEHLCQGSAYEVIETLLHEIRHHWQHKIADLYLDIEFALSDEQLKLSPIKDAKAFAENYENYHRHDDNAAEYLDQPIEKDARQWSSQRIEWYLSFIFSLR